MTVLSILRRFAPLNLNRPLRINQQNTSVITKRLGHDFQIRESQYEWRKFWDINHYYLCISFLFYGSIAAYANIFIGPATLAEIPEGYRPKHWEYYPHPISRFLERTFYTDPQQEYEKMLAKLYDEYTLMRMGLLDDKVREVMRRRKDYRAYYSRPVDSSYYEYSKKADETAERYMSEVDDFV